MGVFSKYEGKKVITLTKNENGEYVVPPEIEAMLPDLSVEQKDGKLILKNIYRDMKITPIGSQIFNNGDCASIDYDASRTKSWYNKIKVNSQEDIRGLIRRTDNTERIEMTVDAESLDPSMAVTFIEEFVDAVERFNADHPKEKKDYYESD